MAKKLSSKLRRSHPRPQTSPIRPCHPPGIGHTISDDASNSGDAIK